MRNKNNRSEEYLFIVKKMITAIILHYERNMKEDIRWIQRLCISLDRNEIFEKFLNKSKFIIFNYDRVFEQSILNYLTIEKELPDDKARERLKNMSIVHVHGSLGDLWNLNGLNFGATQAGKNSIPKNLQSASYSQSVYEKALRYIGASSRIFFLGFGYSKENLYTIGFQDREDYGDILKDKEVYGTVLGILEPETNIPKIKEKLKNYGASDPKLYECEIQKLINEHFEFEKES